MTFEEKFQEEIEKHFLQAIENYPPPSVGEIRQRVRAAILSKIVVQIGGLLLDDQEEIFAAYKRAYLEYAGGGQFSFPLSIKAGIGPYGIGYKIKNAISFSMKHQVDVEGSIGDSGGTDDMFENAGQKENKENAKHHVERSPLRRAPDARSRNENPTGWARGNKLHACGHVEPEEKRRERYRRRGLYPVQGMEQTRGADRAILPQGPTDHRGRANRARRMEGPRHREATE